jgi:hypothetical protein
MTVPYATSGLGMFVGKSVDYHAYGNCKIQNARISNIKRYTTDFTPSTELFNPDAHTIWLSQYNGTLDDIGSHHVNGTYNGDRTATYVPGILNPPSSTTTTTSSSTSTSTSSSSTSTSTSTSSNTTTGAPTGTTTSGPSLANAISLLNTNSQYITYPYNINTNITSGDFTVEGWFNLISAPVGQAIGTYDGDGWTLQMNNDGGNADIWLGWNNGGWTQSYIYNVPVVGVWNHIAGVYDDTAKSITMYLNGHPGTPTTGLTTLPVSNTSNGVYVGAQVGGHDASQIIQNVRVSNIKRYTTTFTPSTTVFTSDANTLFLCTYDNTINDISPNALTGTYTGTGTPNYIPGTLDR